MTINCTCSPGMALMPVPFAILVSLRLGVSSICSSHMTNKKTSPVSALETGQCQINAGVYAHKFQCSNYKISPCSIQVDHF